MFTKLYKYVKDFFKKRELKRKHKKMLEEIRKRDPFIYN